MWHGHLQHHLFSFPQYKDSGTCNIEDHSVTYFNYRIEENFDKKYIFQIFDTESHYLCYSFIMIMDGNVFFPKSLLISQYNRDYSCDNTFSSVREWQSQNYSHAYYVKLSNIENKLTILVIIIPKHLLTIYQMQHCQCLVVVQLTCTDIQIHKICLIGVLTHKIYKLYKMCISITYFAFQYGLKNS